MFFPNSVNTDKICSELGWRPVRSGWPEALADTIAWYDANRAWWERVLSGEYRAS